MIEQLSKTLKAFIKAMYTGVSTQNSTIDVVFRRPVDDFKPDNDTIGMFLYDIFENVELRRNEPNIEYNYESKGGVEMNFNPAGKMPGVYINEADVAGPIVGVATSTAAFIGPAADGPMLTPVKITNWTEFKKYFGEGFKDRVIYSPYAVKGFFENGGSNCYFVRIGKARKAECAITDRADKNLLSIRSLHYLQPDI